MNDNEDGTPEEEEFNLGETEKEDDSPKGHEGYLDEAYDDDSSEIEEFDLNESDNEELHIPPIPIIDEEPLDSSEVSKKSNKLVLLILIIVLIVGYGAYSLLLPGPSDDKHASVQMPPAKRSSVKPTAPPKIKPPESVPVEKKSIKSKVVEEKTVLEPKKDRRPAKPPLEKPFKAERNVIEKPLNTLPHSQESAHEAISSGINKKVKVVKAPLPVGNETGYFVQAGVFIFRHNVNTVKKDIESLGYVPAINVGRKIVKMRRVTVGKWDDIKLAEKVSNKLNNDGYSSKILKLGETTYTVMIGSYYYKKMADEEIIILTAKGYDANIVVVPVDMKAYHILLGPYSTVDEAANIDLNLKDNEINSVIIKPVH